MQVQPQQQEHLATQRSDKSVLSYVPSYAIDDVWPQVLPLILDICRTNGGRYNEHDILHDLQNSDKQLWLSVRNDKIEVVCLTGINVYPRRKYCHIYGGVGRDRNNWLDFIDVIEKWAEDQGCHGVESVCRKGWSRALKGKGYVTSHYFIEKEFPDGQ